MAPKEFKYETYRKSTDLITSRFAKLEETVNKITASPPPLSQVQIRRLNTIFSELKKKRADFESNLQRLIESETPEATEPILSADIDAINDLYIRISSVIESNVTQEPTTPHSSHSSDSTIPHFPSVVTGVKLPKLNLQTFDGSPLKWISFINLFDTTVHKSSSLSNVAKFQYLLSVVTGEPLNLIKSLNLTAANYLVAYQLLRDRYHNIRRLTTLHLNHLLDLPTVPHGNSKQLRSFITTFYEHSKSLKALEYDVAYNNPLLAAHLLRKLDSNTVQRLEQYRENKTDENHPHSLPKVMEIINFLNLECSHIEDASLHSHPEPKVFHSAPSKPKTEKRIQFSSKNVTMLSTAPKHSATKDKIQTCFSCHKPGHKIYQCQVFKDKSPNDRYKIVKDNHR